MPLVTEVGISRRLHTVLDGHQLPFRKRSTTPQFSANVYCGQKAGWIKMSVGTEVGLGPGHIVFDEDPFPQFLGPCLLWPYGWMDQDTTWYGGRRRYVNGDPALPHGKGHNSPHSPTFLPTLIWHGRPSELLLSTGWHII